MPHTSTGFDGQLYYIVETPLGDAAYTMPHTSTGSAGENFYIMSTSSGSVIQCEVPEPPEIPTYPGIQITNTSTNPFYPKLRIQVVGGIDVPLPLDFSFPGIDLNKLLGFPGTPDVPISMGSGTFDFGLDVTFVCPGYPYCGATQACEYTKSSPCWHVDPSEWFSFKIPGIPKMPALPKVPAFSYSIPPKWALPKGCPNYVRSSQNEADGATP
jgi:hypothetical protein